MQDTPRRRAPKPFAREVKAPHPVEPAPSADQPRRAEDQRHCGLNAVAALFEHRPASVQRLLYSERRKAEVGAWCKQLAAGRRPYRLLPENELAKVAGSIHHGGIVAIADPLRVAAFSPGTIAAGAAPGSPPVLVLDGVGNPQNFGAIARSAAYLGVRHLVLSTDPRQAYPSDAAIRVAEGALELLSLWRARDLPTALAALGRHFTTLAAALAPDGIVPDLVPQGRPVAIVLGNEEEGLAAASIAACAHVVTIPGSGTVQSLNVGAAAAILAWHFRAGVPAAPTAGLPR
ncbi:MAG: RNA methyltransferase [Acetobacteraceae bacterium]|nr:RNA methyltransferase [Acetobacteraceae bacterium]